VGYAVDVSDRVTYSVPGVQCEHCARAIRDDVSEVDGVEAVDVDLDAKLVTVRGSARSDEQVRAAIAEAGYEAA
jgi:copper chaperone